MSAPRLQLRLISALLLAVMPLVGSAAAEPSSPAFASGLEAAKARVEAELLAAASAATPNAPEHLTPCVGGFAGGYPCHQIDLLEFLPVSGFAATATNSLWGWTDPLDGREYVLLGLNNGTVFLDISNPEAPVYLGKLPSHTGSSSWRDVRVYQNHAYVVADNNGAHGMQVFDLTQLRGVATPPVTFAATAHYDKVRNVHTISITEETGYAYLVGATTTGAGVTTCSGGLHIVSLANPAAPAFVGCYNDGAYVHENQCFVYHGPDADYTGREICLAARGNAETLDFVDVTNHAAPVRISSLRYQPLGVASYSHQAWFSEDHRYVLLNDELDESNLGHATRTWIFDAQDLDNPVLAGGGGYHQHATAAIDHNLYVRGNFVFQSNYKAGLRVLRLADLAASQLEEVAFFDVFPSSDSSGFDGTWNNYPFFASGVIPVSHITQGLFLLRPTGLCSTPETPGAPAATPGGDRRIDLAWTGSGDPDARFTVERAAGGCTGAFVPIADGLTAPAFADLEASGGVVYGYRVIEKRANGGCASAPSACAEAATTGACTEPPAFAGLASASSIGAPFCAVRLGWSAATPFCGSEVRYEVHRSTDPSFVPGPGTRIAEGLVATQWDDFEAPSQVTVYFAARAVDLAAGAADANLVRRLARATGPVGDGTFATGAEVGDPPLDTGEGFAGGAAPEHVGWHVTTQRAHGGQRSFWSTESDNLCVSLEGELSLTGGESSGLSFWSAWDTETGYDGGVVELSTNGGASWQRLTPASGYPSAIAGNGGTLCGIAPGQGVFGGNNQLSFTSWSVDLAPWAGQLVRLRWLYRTDGSIVRGGWFVDDIAVTHAQVSGACTSGVGIFVDDFELGSVVRWSLVAGLTP